MHRSDRNLQRHAGPEAPRRRPDRFAGSRIAPVACLLLALAVLSGALALVGGCTAPRSSESPWKPCGGDRAMMDAVRAEFLHIWNNYRERGWGHDGLNPAAGHFSDPYGAPLAVTLIDSLGALWLMGEEEEFEQAVDWAARNVSFDRDADVKTDEAAAYLLGGLLSAYQISEDERLLVLARDLGDRLLPAFASPTGLPYAAVNLKTGRPSQPRTTPGHVAVLAFEFGLLARLIAEPDYARPSQAALLFLWERRSALGLLGGAIDVETGEWTDTTSHVDAGLGPFYDALLKAALLFEDETLLRMHSRAVQAARRYLRTPRDGVPWYTSVQMDQGVPSDAYLGASSAFWPGNLVLAGAVEDAGRIATEDAGRVATEDAVLLQDAWVGIWERFGAEPEFYNCETGEVLSPAYMLQPGIAESAFLLWRRMGEVRYREQGKRIVRDLISRCRAPYGYAPLEDLSSGEQAPSADRCHPAGLFRALYLLFASDDAFDLDEWMLGPGAGLHRRL